MRVADFLSSRRPRPPEGLASSLRLEEHSDALDEVLTAAGLARLEEAQARLGRVRESAFRLLEADALLTYACEAALESEDPEAALERILVAAGR
jgi:hypothetical protein